MNINTAYTERATWGAAAFSGQASVFGGTGRASFEDDMKKADQSVDSIGFGSTDANGGLINSVKAIEKSDDLLGQLQFSLLKQAAGDALDSRLGSTFLK